MPTIFKPNISLKLNTHRNTLKTNPSTSQTPRPISSSNPFSPTPKVIEKALPINEKFAQHLLKRSTLKEMVADFSPYKTITQQLAELADRAKTEMESNLINEELQKVKNLIDNIVEPKAKSIIYAALGGTHSSGKKNLEYTKEVAPNLYEDLKNDPAFKDYFPQVINASEATLTFLKKQAEKDLLYDFFNKKSSVTQTIAELFLSGKDIPKDTYSEAQINGVLLLPTGTESRCLAIYLSGTKYESDSRFIDIFRFAGRNHANLPFDDHVEQHHSPAPRM